MIALCCILLAVAGPVSSEMAAPQSSPQTPAFAPGELLVKFRAEVREEAAADFQGWFGISTRKTFAINGYQLVKLPEGADIEEALEIFSANGRRQTIVTKNGDVVSQQGIMVGGSKEREATISSPVASPS